MAQKIIISKPGYDAQSVLADKNKVFDSDLNHLKTFVGGEFQQVVGGSSTVSVPITHNLGYKPLVIAYFNITGDSKWRISMSTVGLETRYNISQNVEIKLTDNNTVDFVCRQAVAGNKTFNVKYEIFYEGNT